MKGSSSKTLTIGSFHENPYKYVAQDFDKSPDELMTLDDKTLAFYNLGSLQLMTIDGCGNLTSISFEGFSQLVSLKRVLPERTCKAFPSLESLTIRSCGIAGKWLPLMLRHAPKLEELILDNCPHITTLLSIEEEENSLSNLITAREDSSSGNPDDALTGLARDGLLHVPLNPISSLKKISVWSCPCLTFNGSKEGLSGFTSLEKLTIQECPKMLSPSVHKDGNDDQANGRWILPQSLGELRINPYLQESQEALQPCFPRNLTCLKNLAVSEGRSLKSLQLHSCTALEELRIERCESLTTLEGLQSLGSLRHLEVHTCPRLHPYLERAGYELCPRLETLKINDPSVLTTSFCKHLTSLQCLELRHSNAERLTDEQERALVLLKSLQELKFCYCWNLEDLPAGLHTLFSLKRLEISFCSCILRLPETGLPLSLEKLEIRQQCSGQLTTQCMLLRTSKLHVII